MAAITPVTQGTTGYIHPDLGVWGGVCAIGDNIRTDTAEPLANRKGLRLSIWYFATVDDADYWTSNLKGVKACAWQGFDATDDCGAATLTTAATGVITFTSEGGAMEGCLWVLSAS
jgi:hypothetical protein